jgi:hypothetical protein
MSKGPEKLRVLAWLGAFLVLPEAVWLMASRRNGFHGKKVSNLSLEPLSVALLSLTVFVVWLAVARRGLRPAAGLVLLALLAAAALAIQRLVPGLSE